MNGGLIHTHVHYRFVTLRAISKACMLWRLSMTDLQVCTSFHIWEPVQPVMMPSHCPSSSLSTALRMPSKPFHKTCHAEPSAAHSSTASPQKRQSLEVCSPLHLFVLIAQPCITCRALSLMARGLDLTCLCPCNYQLLQPTISMAGLRHLTVRADSWGVTHTAAVQRLLDDNDRLRGVLMAGLKQSIADAPTPAQALW